MPSQPFSTGMHPGQPCQSFSSDGMAQYTPGRLTFKDSPFYTILESLTPTVECKGVICFLEGTLRLGEC